MATAVNHTRNSHRQLPVTERSDEQLLLGYRTSGDRRLFEELVRRYQRELYNYLCRYLGDAELAEDVFQMTFLQLHLKCHQFERDRRVRPWLYAVATNQAIDAQRRNRRHKAVSLDRSSSPGDDTAVTWLNLVTDGTVDPSEAAETAEMREWVRTALAELPEHLRMVVTMVYYQGMKYRETADALSIPVGTVKSRMNAAVSKLNEAWQSFQTQKN